MTSQNMTSQIQKSRRLASAFKRCDRLRAKLAEAELQLTEAFQPWSAGRRINRDAAREQLISTGFLDRGRRDA